MRCALLPATLSATLLGPAVWADTVESWRLAIQRDDLAVLTNLAAQIDPNVPDRNGRTALMVAAKYADVPLITSLLERGAAVNQRSSTGGSALMFAVLSGERAAVHALLAADATVTQPSRNGWTALILAAAKNELDIVNQLLAAGADVLHADVYGFNALMRAVENQHMDVVSRLLREDQLQMSQRDSLGNGALHYAASAANERLVQQLMQAGAPNAANHRGMWPVDVLPVTAATSLRDLLRRPDGALASD
ncbi:MAG: ankyrin repeat domain-containing protein [Pseudomonadota bacterium]